MGNKVSSKKRRNTDFFMYIQFEFMKKISFNSYYCNIKNIFLKYHLLLTATTTNTKKKSFAV